MTLLPNIITLFRIAGSLSLLLCDVANDSFWIIYALCGISDIADGWLARKLKCVTRTGALLDSVADICAGVIVAIKVVNQLSALVMYRHCYFPHTAANKATGFLLFIAVPMTFYTVIPIAIVAAIATFAAIHEHYIITNMIKQI